MREREMKSNLCSHVVTRINLDKFNHDLNEKLIIATNNSDNPAWEVNLSKNQEVDYLYIMILNYTLYNVITEDYCKV